MSLTSAFRVFCLSPKHTNLFSGAVNLSSVYVPRRCFHSSYPLFDEPTKSKEEIKAERKARKKEKKKKQEVEEVIEEDPVEKKKRLRKLAKTSVYTGDGSEIDPNSDDLNDNIILERIKSIYEEHDDHGLKVLFDKNTKEKKPIESILISARYGEKYGFPNPYSRLRFCECLINFGEENHFNFTNKEYIESKTNTLARMAASQKFHRIFPDILDKFTPTINLRTHFEHRLAKTVSVHFGNELPAEITENQPHVSFSGKQGSYYTLVLVDAKNPKYLEQFDPSINWIVSNIPHDGDISQGEVLVDYLGGTPLFMKESHRMAFILFRQQFGPNQFVSFPRISSEQFFEREPFDLREFALQHDLVPRGISFFRCKYDWSVKQRLAKFNLGEPIIMRESHIRLRQARKDSSDRIRILGNSKWTWPKIIPETKQKE